MKPAALLLLMSQYGRLAVNPVVVQPNTALFGFSVLFQPTAVTALVVAIASDIAKFAKSIVPEGVVLIVTGGLILIMAFVELVLLPNP